VIRPELYLLSAICGLADSKKEVIIYSRDTPFAVDGPANFTGDQFIRLHICTIFLNLTGVRGEIIECFLAFQPSNYDTIVFLLFFLIYYYKS
jgi:hypothetical protein